MFGLPAWKLILIGGCVVWVVVTLAWPLITRLIAAAGGLPLPTAPASPVNLRRQRLDCYAELADCVAEHGTPEQQAALEKILPCILGHTPNAQAH